jgi:putative peptide zinc metalloprotease protein
MPDRGRRPIAEPADATGTLVPRLAPGVESLGEYQGSGLAVATYLARHPSGQIVQLSQLPYLALSGIDGRRTVAEIAEQVTAVFGRTVSAGNIEYLMANKLAPLGLLEGGEPARAGSGAARQSSGLLALKLRCTLIPEAGVQFLARLFRPLFSPFVVVVALACLIASDTWLFRSGQVGPASEYVVSHPVSVLVLLGLTLLSTLFHECGHAAACRYGGVRPGVIGMGFYVMWPAFFTDVTDAYRLGRAGRVRTDLGGVYFNAIFVLALMAAYGTTGIPVLAAAIVLTHAEIVQQLVPSLRFDGYFILADLIGVPDLFRRIGPTLRGLIPGQPKDARVQDLKRPARLIITAWVMLIVPLLGTELTLVILNGPALVRTLARSLSAGQQAAVAQFGRAEIAAGLVTVISTVLLVLPMAGLAYILCRVSRTTFRRAVLATRGHPALRFLAAAGILIAAAGLTVHWGVLPLRAGATPRAFVAGQRPDRAVLAGGRPGCRERRAGALLERVRAVEFDTLEALGRKKGSGLILDMGRRVSVSSVMIKFGRQRGADVSIEVGNHAPAAARLSTFRTVGRADGIGGTYTIKVTCPVRGRYVLARFTKLPSAGAGRFAAGTFTIVIRGSA